jgi:hypothetical protein
MITDSELRAKGAEILVNGLGLIEAERFVASLLREPFDYSEWSQKLFADKSVEQLYREAKAHFDRQKPSKES